MSLQTNAVALTTATSNESSAPPTPSSTSEPVGKYVSTCVSSQSVLLTGSLCHSLLGV